MSELLLIVGAVLLFGLVSVSPMFGLTSDELGLIVGGAFIVLGVFAHAVERLAGKKGGEL